MIYPLNPERLEIERRESELEYPFADDDDTPQPRYCGRWIDITGLWLEIDSLGFTTHPRGEGGFKHAHVTVTYLQIHRAGNWILETRAPARIYGRDTWLGRLVLHLYLMWRLRRLTL